MRTLLTAVFVALLGTTAAAAQQPDSSRADSLRRARQPRNLDSLAAVIRSLEARIDSLAAGQPQSPPARTSGAYMNIGFDGLADFGWSSEADVAALQRGDHDPHVRGFTVPNAELSLDGAVDPYFKGFANLVYKIDPSGETGVELEEVYFLTTQLLGNLQLRKAYPPHLGG